MIDRGRIGRGFSLDGSNQYVMVPFHPSLDVAQESIVFWMRADPSNLMNGCCQGLVTTDHFAVEISGGHDPIVGVNFFVFTTDGGFVHTSDGNGGGAVVSPGEWHHIAGTYDGTRLQLYVNGEPWGNAVLHTGDIVPMSPGGFLVLASSTCSDIAGDAYAFELGQNTFSATAADHAGNAARASTTFTVSVTITTLASLTERFVTYRGVEQSLKAKLDASASRVSTAACSGSTRRPGRPARPQ